MASKATPHVPMHGNECRGDVAPQRQWRMRARLSSTGDAVERFLARAGFERGPWLAVAFMAGIAAWFVIGSPAGWVMVISGGVMMALASTAIWKGNPARTWLMLAAISVGLAVAAGAALVWARSELVGSRPIARAVVAVLDVRVLERMEQPARERIRLVVATREPATGRPIKVRLNLPETDDAPFAKEGAVLRLKARLMPPASPLLPGGYNFARAAWFEGLAATGRVVGPITLLEEGPETGAVGAQQRALSEHVRKRLSGSEGAIASALATGDRGAIAAGDEEAMRDSGLAHLLSISGLHVSAVIAAVYLLSIRLLALWPWMALRFRLPLVAAATGAIAGVGYTWLTGAEVPTVRSCLGALLVLVAMAMGREPLSMRVIAVVAVAVLAVWPEAIAGPSFQMSFAAVVAIVALHGSAPCRAFLAAREERWLSRMARRLVMLLLTGVVVELALMPIGLYHFHKAGVYGALANVIAIPLVTFISMPFIAVALLLDLVGAGGPAWWIAGKSLEILLGIAHWTADQPGSVRHLPAITNPAFAAFVAGGLWLALWRGWFRMLGLLPVGLATLAVANTPPPDLLVAGDGRQVAFRSGDGAIYLLRDSRSGFVRDNMLELSGVVRAGGLVRATRASRCSRDFCSVTLSRGGRHWHVLAATGRDRVEERALMAACERADIVIADRWLPRSCRPRWLKADRRMLSRTGGLAINLAQERIRSVADGEGQHGWWRSSDP